MWNGIKQFLKFWLVGLVVIAPWTIITDVLFGLLVTQTSFSQPDSILEFIRARIATTLVIVFCYLFFFGAVGVLTLERRGWQDVLSLVKSCFLWSLAGAVILGGCAGVLMIMLDSGATHAFPFKESFATGFFAGGQLGFLAGLIGGLVKFAYNLGNPGEIPEPH